MPRIARVAGFAAASLIVAASATYAGPSFAWEVQPAAELPPTYFDHALAAPADEAPLETLAPPSVPDSDVPNDVIGHADAELEADTRSLSELVAAYASNDVDDSEHECLAGAVYFESKGEPLQGQLAVAEVILNRAGSGRFPASICGVVKQKSQFSFVRGGRIPPISRNSPAWRKAVAIAHIAKRDLNEAGIGNAMFFHARYVSPGWRRLTRVASIGNHIFYR
jgi:spore germination cell wall hydrolase CwlJ-like protein